MLTAKLAPGGVIVNIPFDEFDFRMKNQQLVYDYKVLFI